MMRFTSREGMRRKAEGIALSRHTVLQKQKLGGIFPGQRVPQNHFFAQGGRGCRIISDQYRSKGRIIAGPVATRQAAEPAKPKCPPARLAPGH